MIDKKSILRKSLRHSIGQLVVEFAWEENRREGEYSCTYPDGSMYNGTFKAGRFHGKGTYTWVDGSRYEGQWSDDLPQGQGIWDIQAGRLPRGIYSYRIMTDENSITGNLVKVE